MIQHINHYTTYGGGVISRVLPGSIAEEIGLHPGDRVIAVGDHILRDVIDYRFAIADEQIDLLVHSEGENIVYEIEKDSDDELGIEFTETLFDRVKTCSNACAFCFVAQMPPGLRSSLYVKDDDYRLSFLYGNFITLLNLREADWQRIANQHLSPLYVSVHATDPALRARLMGRRKVPNMLAQLRRIGNLGINVHTQIVACPGINDGAALRQTIHDLAALYPVVQSIAIVPVGLTRYRPHATAARPIAPDIPIRSFTADEAASVVELAASLGKTYRRTLGVQLVYPSDELFLLAGSDIPPTPFYDSYPHYFNGVGMTRDFLENWQRIRRHIPTRATAPMRVALACGTLIAPVFQRLLGSLSAGNLEWQVAPVVNQFFGETVTVSGLLTGQDVVATLRADHYTHAILPRAMFDHEGNRTLDEYHLHDIAEATGLPVQIASHPDELVACVQDMTHETMRSIQGYQQ